MMDDFSIPLSAVNKTDDTGRFFIAEVVPGPAQLTGLPPTSQKIQKSYELLSMKIGEITFYPTVPSYIEGIKFSIDRVHTSKTLKSRCDLVLGIEGKSFPRRADHLRAQKSDSMSEVSIT